MPYRETEPPSKTGEHVAVRSYLDLVVAELTRLQLQEARIGAFVIEATSFNPALAGSAGGHRVMVDDADLERADAMLLRAERDAGAEDHEPKGTVRCPRCELAYCNFRRPSPWSVQFRLSPLLAFASLLAFPVLLFLPKRWRCDRCGHVWDRAGEGPERPTPLAAGEAPPVFLLVRDHGGLGYVVAFFFAIMELGVFLAAPLPRLIPLWIAAPFLVAILGVAIGRRVRSYVCSAPDCGADLGPSSKACPRCRGAISGRVKSRPEHFAAAAAARRALASGDRPKTGDQGRTKKRKRKRVPA